MSDRSSDVDRDAAEEAREEDPQATEDEGAQASGGDSGEIDEEEDPKAVVRKLEEEGPPERLEDWPQGKAKYETFGGPEGEHGYHEGPEQQMGPSSLRHHEGGEVSIAGEMVDDPDEYKGDPVPGGPTDPNTPDQPGEREKETEDGDGED